MAGGGGMCWGRGGMRGRGHVWWGGMHSRGVCVHGGGHAWRGERAWQILRDTVNKRAVRILLECILIVCFFFIVVIVAWAETVFS